MSEIINNPANEPEEQGQNNQEEQENKEVRPGTWDPDKDKYPHGEREQSIGSWWNPEPEEQNVEHGIGDSH